MRESKFTKPYGAIFFVNISNLIKIACVGLVVARASVGLTEPVCPTQGCAFGGRPGCSGERDLKLDSVKNACFGHQAQGTGEVRMREASGTAV